MNARLAEIKQEQKRTWQELNKLKGVGDPEVRARRSALYDTLRPLDAEERELTKRFADLIRNLEDAAYAAGEEAAVSGGFLTASTLELVQEAKEALYRALAK